MTLRFDGRVVIVTGAGRGLGRAHALLLGSLGARVVVNDLGCSPEGGEGSPTPAEQVASEIEAQGGVAFANAGDVATDGGVGALVDAALDRFGRVDAVVHNAGIVGRADVPDITTATLRDIISVHLVGGFLLAKAVWPGMVARGYGRFVNTTSAAGLFGMGNNAMYGAAKAGLVALTKTQAEEGAPHGIRANCIAPIVFTRLGERVISGQQAEWQRAHADPSRVSPAVAWLAHERCTLSGEILTAGVGRVARIYVAETRGVVRPDWSIDDVDREMATICDPTDALIIENLAQELALFGSEIGERRSP